MSDLFTAMRTELEKEIELCEKRLAIVKDNWKFYRNDDPDNKRLHQVIANEWLRSAAYIRGLKFALKLKDEEDIKT